MVGSPSAPSDCKAEGEIAFDMTNPDVEVAARAKEDFTQCCAWLRHFSSMWPAASAHKLFFEAGEWRCARENPQGWQAVPYSSS